MSLFGKKKRRVKPQPYPPTPYYPSDIVRRYASQGMPENEIRGRLSSQGFRPDQIERSIRDTLKAEVGPRSMPRPMPRPMERRPPGPMTRPPMGPPIERRPMRAPMAPGPMERPPMARQPYPPQERAPMPPIQPPRGEPVFTFEKTKETIEEMPETDVTLEEVIEGVVAERWSDFEDRLKNFEKRDIQLQQQISDYRKKIEDLEKKLAQKEQTLFGRFDEFGESMDTIQGRIGSIETIFKQTLPELVDNIKTISEIVDKMKSKK